MSLKKFYDSSELGTLSQVNKINHTFLLLWIGNDQKWCASRTPLPGPSCSKRGQHYPLDKSLSISFPNTRLLDSDLSGGQRPLFEQPGLMFIFVTLSLRLHWTPTQLFSVLSLINTSPQRNLHSSFSLERSITGRGKERLRGRLRFLSFYLCISCP